MTVVVLSLVEPTIYSFVESDPGSDRTIAYCRIGERSSHTWFILTHLGSASPGAQITTGPDRMGQTASAPRATGDACFDRTGSL